MRVLMLQRVHWRSRGWGYRNKNNNSNNNRSYRVWWRWEYHLLFLLLLTSLLLLLSPVVSLDNADDSITTTIKTTTTTNHHNNNDGDNSAVVYIENDGTTTATTMKRAAETTTTTLNATTGTTASTMSNRTSNTITTTTTATISSSNRSIDQSQSQQQHQLPIDPNLRILPGYDDFYAYVRPDIQTFYEQQQQQQQQQKEQNEQQQNEDDDDKNDQEYQPPRYYQQYQHQAGKFVNMSPKVTSLYWVDNSYSSNDNNDDDDNDNYDDESIVLIESRIGPWGSTGTATFPSHRFILTMYQTPSIIYCTFDVQIHVSIYYCDPYKTTIIMNNNDTAATTTTSFEEEENEYKYSRSGRVHTKNLERYPFPLLNHKQREQYYNLLRHNLVFGDLYQNFTNGSPWLTLYPPISIHQQYLPMWSADYFNQTHVITTNETHFHTNPLQHPTLINTTTTSTTTTRNQNFGIRLIHQVREWWQKKMKTYSRFNNPFLLSIEQMALPTHAKPHLQSYRYPGTMNITLQVLSCAPRVFLIEKFLSDVEVEHILSLVRRKNDMTRSETTTGALSTTRTSRTTWISRNEDDIINTIHRRVADTVRINEALLRPKRKRHHLHQKVYNSMKDTWRKMTNAKNWNHHQQQKPPLVAESLDMLPPKEIIRGNGPLNEAMQIVHYDTTQEFQPHHDFGYPPGVKMSDRDDRYLNVAFYLNDVEEGGETAFPRYRHKVPNHDNNNKNPYYDHESHILKIKPTKGNAILFYMFTPDGNLDDLSQHAGLPVIKGEKYFANLWIRTNTM